MALRICSGAFRTSPVQSLYVNCNQLPLDLRRRKLSLAYYFKILSVSSHPLQNVYMSTSMKILYEARPPNIRPFMDRMKLLVSELDLPNVNIQQRNLLLFQPWNTPRFHYINPFASYSKSTVKPVIFQRVFAYHRSQYRRYSAIYTDGSKRADNVGCEVVIEDATHGYLLDPSCSVFTAEAVAIYRALQAIDPNMPHEYCIYTDSMSVLEAIENYNDRCHPVVCNILDITSRLYSKGFDIVFCWLPSHVGIIGNEQADSAARSATTYMPLAVPLSDIKRVILHHIFKICQESWSLQLDNKLHSVKPVVEAWPVMPMQRTDVKLSRLRIGHTRFTHRHLLFGENAPECPSCKAFYTVRHILIDCPVFNHHRITFFRTSILTLSELPLPRGILIGQWKGSLRGRVCGGRVACVVGDGSKERSAESGPRGRGTWLRMARLWGLLHIEKSSMASALDRARQHVMGGTRCLALKNPPAVTLGTLEKCGNS
ncbi:RNase H domain-containing protein [Trichonephila clavipes]|nr:RNase H domain-containing protein [Trichonephila clavipes]